MHQAVARPRGRPKKDAAAEPAAYIRWRNGRAYGEFQAWAKWGGRRQEPLIQDGEKNATENSTTAAILFGKRLEQLRSTRTANPAGIPTDTLDRFAAFAGHHLACKAEVQGRRRPNERHLAMLRRRLIYAAKFFKARGVVHLRNLGPEDVKAYRQHLVTAEPERAEGSRGGRKGPLSPTTQRRYLDALGEMLQRAVGDGRIQKNWVAEMPDKPTVDPSPTEHLELGDCALLLELARRLYPPGEGRPVYEKIAGHLLSGCTDSELHGLQKIDVRMPGDPEYPLGIIMVRRNSSRATLKNDHRDRFIPLHPQLAEIWAPLVERTAGETGPLFLSEPGSDGHQPLGDCRKALDALAHGCGLPPARVRSRAFRVSYATHRLCTVDEVGQPMTAWKLRGEMGHGSEQMIEQRYGRYARHRARRPVLEYRWAEWEPTHLLRLATGLRAILTPGQVAALATLAEATEPLTPAELARRAGAPSASMVAQRDRLVALGLIIETPARRYALRPDGAAVLSVKAVQRPLPRLRRRAKVSTSASSDS